MPSRKKAKGKARKAAKETKAKEGESRAVSGVVEGSRAVVEANQVKERSLETRFERLIINSSSSDDMCRHGFPPLSSDEGKIFEGFINAFIDAFQCPVNTIAQCLATGLQATLEEYAEVYNSKLETVISILLASGTQCILDGGKNTAQPELYATLAFYFEDTTAVYLRKAQIPNYTKLTELCGTDKHTLVSFYRKRIPCSCLDGKYKEVKSVKKTGLCHNPNCSLYYGRVEKSKMLSCTRCGVANYCSVECQKGHWKEHKVECEEVVKQKAAFDSDQTKLLAVKKWLSNVARLLLQWLLIAIWAKVLGVEADADAVVCFVSIHGFFSPIIFLPFESFICSM